MSNIYSDSVYFLVKELCESLLLEFNPNTTKNQTAVRKVKSTAYEILLKKSLNCIIKANSEWDSLREFDIRNFEMRMNSRIDPEIWKSRETLEICYQNLTENSNNEIKGLLTFLLNLEDYTEKDQNEIEYVCGLSRLLVPGPFTLYSEYTKNVYYPQMCSGNIFSKSISGLKNLKDFENPYLPRFIFQRESKEFTKIESKLNISPRQKLSAFIQPTWILPINIDPSAYRFFNNDQDSTISIDKFSNKDICRKDINSKIINKDFNEEKYVLNWNWENLDKIGIPFPKAFITEMDSTLHLHGALENELGGKFIFKIVRINRFILDLKALTVGIQSDSFSHNDMCIFLMDPNITIPEISLTTIKNFVSEFLECGICYKRLQIMIKKKNYKLMYDGFMFKALCNSIEEYLVMFRQYIIQFDDKTVLQYYVRVKKIIKQIISLAHILAIHPNVDVNVKTPMGSQFLGYLYKEITNITQNDLIMLLVYILKRCCHVYFKHLKKWIFYGLLDDPCNELFICFVDHYRPNTKYFYDKAYFVKKDAVPGFFQGYEDQILQCGKYTMLLKAFKPNHPLFSIQYPSISVCLSFEEIQIMEENCQDYRRKAREICGDPITVRNIVEKRAIHKTAFYQLVSEKSRKNLEKWTTERNTEATIKHREKKKRLIDLQKQLQETHERKLADRKANLLLELKVLKEGQEIDDKRLAEENLTIQKRIQYYKELHDLIEEKEQLSKTENHIPETPTSAGTEFESCIGDDEEENRMEIEDENDYEDGKSIYEDTSYISTEFLNDFQKTEKELEKISSNSDDKPLSVDYLKVNIKKSTSDLFNSNDIISEFHKNRNKIMPSQQITHYGSNTTTNYDYEHNPDYNLNSISIQETLETDLERDRNRMMNTTNMINNNNDKITINEVKKKECLTELEKNRLKMMANNPFVMFNQQNDRKMLNLDLDTELSRNRKRVLESEFNIITGNRNINYDSTTPMSTTSDDDIGLLSLLKVNIEVAQNLDIDRMNLDIPTAIILDTPECGLNTAGIMAKDGFSFDSNHQDHQQNSSSILVHDTQILTDLYDEKYIVNTPQTPYQRCEELINTNFQCKPNNSIFSLNLIEETTSSNDNENIDFGNSRKNLNSLSIITLTEFLQKSIKIPLNIHLEIMNNEIMRIFLDDLDILGHFKSLRNYFFLMDGEFGSNICDGLISKLEMGAQPNELLNYQMLHTILENALGSSIIGNDKNSQNLSFIVTDMPEKFDLNSPTVLSTHLSLSYSIQWPINLILNPETLEQYANIFKYLIKVRRISWVLEESYQILKEICKKNRKDILLSPQYRRVQQIRHKFFHFVNALKNHITSNALQASWKTFKDDLYSATTIEDIYRKHTIYIKRILFLCMLNRRSIDFYNNIENIFKVTLRFYRNLKSRQWKRKDNNEHFTHSRYEKLLADEIEFEKLIKYTIYLGNKIVRRGYQEEIGEFINLINFNHYYVVE